MRALCFLAINGHLLGVHKCETSDFLLGAAGFNMGKVRQFPPTWIAFVVQTTIVTAGLSVSKIHLMPFQLTGALNPAEL
jgi:hypothetical protein